LINTLILSSELPRLYPKNAQERGKVDLLLCWDMGDLYASIMQAFYPKFGFIPMPSTEQMKKNQDNFHSKLDFLDQHLIKVLNSYPFLTLALYYSTRENI